MPKIVTREDIERVIKKHSIRWKVSDLFRLNDTKRKEYYCSCSCGQTSKWIPWAKLSKGESRSCQKCSKKNIALNVRGLKHSWYDLRKKSIRNGVPLNFIEFSHFADWSLANGWIKGKVLHTIPNAENYGPRTCYWKSVYMLKEFSSELGVDRTLVFYYLKKGMNFYQIREMFSRRVEKN